MVDWISDKTNTVVKKTPSCCSKSGCMVMSELIKCLNIMIFRKELFFQKLHGLPYVYIPYVYSTHVYFYLFYFAISSGQISCLHTGFFWTFRGISVYDIEVVESSSLSNLLFWTDFCQKISWLHGRHSSVLFFSCILQVAKREGLR